MDKLVSKHGEPLKAIEGVKQDIDKFDGIIGETLVEAPRVKPNLYFDLTPNTMVAKVKHNILIHGDNPIGAVVVGAGGTGKITAVYHIAHLTDIKASFPGGVLYTALGAVAEARDVVCSLGDLVDSLDEPAAADKVRKCSTVDKAVKEASRAFRGKECLIILDVA